MSLTRVVCDMLLRRQQTQLNHTLNHVSTPSASTAAASAAASAANAASGPQDNSLFTREASRFLLNITIPRPTQTVGTQNTQNAATQNLGATETLGNSPTGAASPRGYHPGLNSSQQMQENVAYGHRLIEANVHEAVFMLLRQPTTSGTTASSTASSATSGTTHNVLNHAARASLTRALQNIFCYPTNALKLTNRALDPALKVLKDAVTAPPALIASSAATAASPHMHGNRTNGNVTNTANKSALNNNSGASTGPAQPQPQHTVDVDSAVAAANVLYNLACVPECRAELVDNKVHVKVSLVFHMVVRLRSPYPSFKATILFVFLCIFSWYKTTLYNQMCLRVVSFGLCDLFLLTRCWKSCPPCNNRHTRCHNQVRYLT